MLLNMVKVEKASAVPTSLARKCLDFTGFSAGNCAGMQPNHCTAEIALAVVTFEAEDHPSPLPSRGTQVAFPDHHISEAKKIDRDENVTRITATHVHRTGHSFIQAIMFFPRKTSSSPLGTQSRITLFTRGAVRV
jgi:hypothetical protein